MDRIRGDIRDGALLDRLFSLQHIQIVVHAAACKYVPQLEADPLTAISVNALGTRRLLQAAQKGRAEQFVLLSTDKAVEPASMLGASKRIAELLALRSPGFIPRVKVLRLGNVLGSTGSVGPLLREQLANGSALTVTHRDATRYFITAEEAVRHLLQAIAAEAAPSLWVPRMGRPRRITELAQFLQDLQQPERGPVTLRYTGLRPGDKISEQLLSTTEQSLPTPFADLVRIGGAAPSLSAVTEAVRQIEFAVQSKDIPLLIDAVRLLLPDYRPSATVSALAAAHAAVCAP